MTTPQTHRHYRNRLLVAVATFIYLTLLAAWQLDRVTSDPVEPLGALMLGVLIGAMCGAAIVVRNRLRLFLASRI